MQSEVGVFCLVVDIYLERVMHLIILPYIQSRSQGKELKLCLNGWRKNCQFDYHFVVIGEFDESLRTEFHWVEFIHCPTIEKKDSQYNPHLDIQHKMELAMERFGDKYDGFIVQRYIDEQAYRWNTREEKNTYRFHDMFRKAVKHFDYNDVLSLSSVVDIEYRIFHTKVYYAWYSHKVA